MSWNQDWGERHQQPQVCNDITVMAESEEELESLLVRVKEENERTSLKLNIKKKVGSWHPAPLMPDT